MRSMLSRIRARGSRSARAASLSRRAPPLAPSRRRLTICSMYTHTFITSTIPQVSFVRSFLFPLSPSFIVPVSSLCRSRLRVAFASVRVQPTAVGAPSSDGPSPRSRSSPSFAIDALRSRVDASHARAHDRVAISNDSLKSVVCRAIDSPTSATSFERVDDRIDRSIATSARTRMVDQSLTVTPNAELPFACTSPIDDECEKCEERERDVDRATREKRTQKGTRETGVDEGDDRWDDRGSRAGARLNGARARSREE